MKKATAILLLLISLGSLKIQAQKKILLFYKAAGFQHESIIPGVTALRSLGKQNNFLVDSTDDAGKFTTENLQQYQAIVFVSTTGNVLNEQQQTAFEQYIRSGGGYVGIHAASDCEKDWQWYGNLVGGYFETHDAVQPARLLVKKSALPGMKQLPEIWTRTDEWYEFKWINKEQLNVLIEIDGNSYKCNGKENTHPVAWYHDYNGGRVFYTALGHTKESYTEPLFLALLLAGINYATGNNNL